MAASLEDTDIEEQEEEEEEEKEEEEDSVPFPIEPPSEAEKAKEEEETFTPEDDEASYFNRWIRFFSHADLMKEKPTTIIGAELDNLISRLVPAIDNDNQELFDKEFGEEAINPDLMWEQTTSLTLATVNIPGADGVFRACIKKKELELLQQVEKRVSDGDPLVYSMKQNMDPYIQRMRTELTLTFLNYYFIIRMGLMRNPQFPEFCAAFDTLEEARKVIEHKGHEWVNLDSLYDLWRGDFNCHKQLFYELLINVIHGSEARPLSKILKNLCICRYYHINFYFDSMYEDVLYVTLNSPSYLGAYPCRLLPSERFEGSMWEMMIIQHPTWTRAQEDEKMYDGIIRLLQRMKEGHLERIGKQIDLPSFFMNVLTDYLHGANDRPSSKRQRSST